MWTLHANDEDEDGYDVVDGVAADGRMMLNLDRWNVAAAVTLRDAGVAAGTYRLRAIDVILRWSTTVRW